MVAKDAVPFHGGTSGSNPLRSSGESCGNSEARPLLCGRDAMGRAADMATSSLHLTSMECRDAPAERLEQVPRPVRVSSETLPRSRRACMRYPPSLISMQPFHALRRRIDQFAELWLDPSWRLGDWPRGTLVVDLAITAWGSSSPHEIPSEMLD